MYSQMFITGQRQLDPDKLSKVMFMCGLTVASKVKPNWSVDESLSQVDRIVETAAADENTLLKDLYLQIFHVAQQ